MNNLWFFKPAYIFKNNLCIIKISYKFWKNESIMIDNKVINYIYEDKFIFSKIFFLVNNVR